MAPTDAVALIGLFLRLRQDFAYFHSRASTNSVGRLSHTEGLVTAWGLGNTLDPPDPLRLPTLKLRPPRRTRQDVPYRYYDAFHALMKHPDASPLKQSF